MPGDLPARRAVPRFPAILRKPARIGYRGRKACPSRCWRAGACQASNYLIFQTKMVIPDGHSCYNPEA
jgi:hypothetical protein